MRPFTRPEISVIVPVRDGAGPLRILLESLEHQTLARERFEVIVVDNGSQDETASVARCGGVRLVQEQERGHPRARPRNLGAAAAAAERFAFTDVDCVPTPHWLEAFAEAAGSAPLIAGPVTVTVEPNPNVVQRFERRWRFAQEPWVRSGWAATANLLVERRVFDAVGGFDEAYRHSGEDADFCVRARRVGFELGYCPNAQVLHPAEDRLRRSLERSFRYGYGATQGLRRTGAGERAWRRLRPLLDDCAALTAIGVDTSDLEPAERRRMHRLARASYMARILGSLWCDVRRTS